MNLVLAIDNACEHRAIPGREAIEGWIRMALEGQRESAELCIRIVDEEEGRALNKRWRQKDYATNILSFPCTGLSHVNPEPLGDLAICAAVLEREAEQQHKPVQAHWAHLIVHGVFHLLGYDHQKEAEALLMEGKEIEILARLGFNNPYLNDE